MLQVDDKLMDRAVQSGDEATVSYLCDKAAMLPKQVSTSVGNENGAMCTSPSMVAHFASRLAFSTTG